MGLFAIVMVAGLRNVDQERRKWCVRHCPLSAIADRPGSQGEHPSSNYGHSGGASSSAPGGRRAAGRPVAGGRPNRDNSTRRRIAQLNITSDVRNQTSRPWRRVVADALPASLNLNCDTPQPALAAHEARTTGELTSCAGIIRADGDTDLLQLPGETSISHGGSRTFPPRPP